MDAFTKAATNRSIRNIKTELDFLADASLLTPSQVSAIYALLPDAPAPSSSNAARDVYTPPTSQLSSVAISEHRQQHQQPTPQSTSTLSLPPPAYNQTPSTIATASALYEYEPKEAGDMALQPHDRISITEFKNPDWAMGRNERTGQEGVFPRIYVNVVEEKKGGQGGPPPLPPVQQKQGSSYGNMPLDVANGQQQQQQQQAPFVSGGGNSKMNEHGKKFGKKLGNAAIFGAGASIGSNIVNGIF